MNCQNCAKQYLCNRKECNFKSWLETKNYGEVRREKSERCRDYRIFKK